MNFTKFTQLPGFLDLRIIFYGGLQYRIVVEICKFEGFKNSLLRIIATEQN